METNENDTFNFGGTTETTPQVQTGFSYPEKIDVGDKLPSENKGDVEMSVDDGIMKAVDTGEAAQTGEVDKVGDGKAPNQSQHNAEIVKNKQNMSYSHQTGDALAAAPSADHNSPSKQRVTSTSSTVHINSPAHNQTGAGDGVETVHLESAEKDVAPSGNHESTPDVEKKEVVNEEDQEKVEPSAVEPAVEGPAVVESTVTNSEPQEATSENAVNNDGHDSEGDEEMKVEDVSEATNDNSKVEESTTEPVVEEPSDDKATSETGEADDDVEMKDAVDSQDRVKPTKDDDQGEVEIRDVTDKEEEQVEEKKSAEELLIEHINTVYHCFDDFMKTKDEVKIKDCMTLLTEIKSLAVKTVDSLKTFTVHKDVDKGHSSSKKSKRGKSNTKQIIKTTLKTEKNNAIEVESDSPDPLEEVNLKEIKGLAVFAKWPNSGWFYPGVVKDLLLSEWKTTPNITVTFYDGLERDMKSMNIFPAELIPTSSVLFDLDDEMDMTVSNVESDDNWVKYVVNCSGQPDVTKDFDKMAIKGVHMKSIKQAVDTSASDAASKAENLVSGRRARGKSSLFNEDYVSSSSPRSVEKRKSKVDDSKSTPAKTPAKRKSSSKEDEVGESIPSRSSSKRRQVMNGTKSTPRRSAKK